MDFENLPDIISEKIVMFAAEKEYMELFKKLRGPKRKRSFYVGKWMEILYKYGQVYPKWKNMIYGSKILFLEDEADEVEVAEEEGNEDQVEEDKLYCPTKERLVHSLNFSTGRVKIYDGKRGLRI